MVETLKSLTEYIDCRIVGVYGGTNMNTQKIMLQEGADIVVATPGRLYDLALCRALQLKGIKKIVIDEVDVMLDLGFRFQLINISNEATSHLQLMNLFGKVAFLLGYITLT